MTKYARAQVRRLEVASGTSFTEFLRGKIIMRKIPIGETLISMELGPFTICLTVKDLQVSKSFYEKLGFTAFSPDPSHKNWLRMKNGETVIGLFQGIFDKNTLCFNPGGHYGEPLADFTDIRELALELKAKGVQLEQEEGLTSKSGPAGFLKDPDGNPILVEQHV